MKKIILSIIATGFCFWANAQPPEGDAKPGDWYGADISTENAISLKDAVTKVQESGKLPLTKVKAKVLNVCEKKGCWINVQIDDSTTAFVKMKDYAFFLPLAIKGKMVVLDAEISQKSISVAEQKHYAQDAKKLQEEIDAITKSKKEIRLLASGIVVVD